MRITPSQISGIVGIFWIGWFALSMQGIIPDPISPMVRFAIGDVQILNDLKQMDCETLGSWIVNNTGTVLPYQTEANNIYDIKCDLPQQKQDSVKQMNKDPCGNNLITDHMFDTDYPDGCYICGWSHKEIRRGYKDKGEKNN